MKKLLTILILFILIAQTSGYIAVKMHDIGFIQGADEKDDKASKEKKEKEYISQAVSIGAALISKRSFSFYSCKPGLSPVLDHITPPPDVMV